MYAITPSGNHAFSCFISFVSRMLVAVASLFAKGINKIAQKVGEEAVETVIEAKDNDKGLFLNESADLPNNFTAIAISTTPNILRITPIPEGPNTRSMRLEDFNTMYTIMMLTMIATMRFARSYSARNERIEVSVPAPAIMGNAMGTMDAVSEDSSL